MKEIMTRKLLWDLPAQFLNRIVKFAKKIFLELLADYSQFSRRNMLYLMLNKIKFY